MLNGKEGPSMTKIKIHICIIMSYALTKRYIIDYIRYNKTST